MEIAVVILIGEKARLTIDAALDNVQRVFSKKYPAATRHHYAIKKLMALTPFRFAW
jgi:hypothetical protein